MLTHVCMWSAKGWVPTTAAEVVRAHPNVGTVSARHELFFCEICGQYVTLANGSQRKYFKHSSSEKDKTCKQRARNFYKLDWTKADEDHPPQLEPPLIICVGKYELHFECDGKYLSTGNVIAKLDERGELFSSTSGKRLLPDSDVRLGKQYYLLTTNSPGLIQTDIEINDTGMHYRQWRLYELKATALTEDAAKFFLRYHCRLTAHPISLRVLYPIYTLDRYKIRHDARELYMYLEGNANFFPRASYTKLSDDGSGKLISFCSNTRQQLTVLAGRAQPLKALYFKREMPTFDLDMPTVEVADIAGARIVEGVEGVLHVLPRDRVLRLRAEFDGYVELERDGYVEDRIDFRADEPTDVIGIGFGLTIKIFVGLDCVRAIRYERSENDSASDEETYRRLELGRGRLILISHAWGALLDRLKDYPLVAGWLRKTIRAGHARSGSWEAFRRFVLRLGESNGSV